MTNIPEIGDRVMVRCLDGRPDVGTVECVMVLAGMHDTPFSFVIVDFGDHNEQMEIDNIIRYL